MRSNEWGSRAALAALCVAATACAVTPAGGQSRPRNERKPPNLTAPAGPPPLPAPGLRPLADEISPGAAPLMRGLAPEKDERLSNAANYGAPIKREKLPRPYPPRRIGAPPPFSPKNPLPPLEPYKTSAQGKRALRMRPTVQPPLPEPPPPVTVAVEPTIKVKPRPKVELNPYDPVGVGVGSLRLYPFVEASGGYDDNPNRLAPQLNPRASAVFRGEGGFKLKSEWARHNLDAELRGGYSEYFNYPLASRPDAAGLLNARYDVTRDTSLDLRGRLSLDTIRPGAPQLFSGVQTVTVLNRPIVFGVSAAPGVTHRFNRLELSLRGTFERVFYENARYSDGTILDLARTSYDGYGGTGRLSYEVTPDLKPFVEGTYDWRKHDLPTDFNGFYRDSSGFIVRGGAVVNVTELVKGEVSGGYAERHYDDPRLTPLRGPVIDAALIYTPSALTTLTLRGSTTLSETTLANASGVLTQSISAQLSHDLLRNLNVSLLGSYFNNDYQGADVRERGGSVGVKLDYKITRSISLRGSYIHELLDSSFPNADYTANVYLVGLRFQL